jgi:hypothetical protein
MKNLSKLALMSAALLATAACSELVGSKNRVVVDPSLSVAFATIPVAYSNTQNTYSASAEGTGPFFPGGDRGGMGRDMGPGLGGGLGPMIGNNLGDNFIGGKGLGRDMGHGRHGDPDINASLTSCTFNASNGRVECAADTRNGITTLRSVAFTNAAGTAQSAFDSVTTNTINTVVTVSGTVTRRDSSVTTLAHNSNRTVTGLAAGSTKHTINATSAGTESTTGTNKDGAFTAKRVASDTISGLIVPVTDTGKTYPTAGTVIRNMSVTRTVAGTTTSSTRREVLTYDGSATAKMVVTQDGTTKTCSLPLPFGRPTCQ